jgi:tRNA (adenine22-N1)-methyltransferase
VTAVLHRPARLGPRLRSLLDLCPVEGPVADIGSGHGRLAYELALRLPAGQVFATEAKRGPAAELRRLLGPLAPVTILEGDGLAPLRHVGCRGAVIAGMGGRTMAGILTADEDVASSLAWICLQPIQRVELLAGWLSQQGLWTVRRTIAMERRHTYHSFLLERR